MNIIKSPIKSSQIKFLNRDKTLYSSDFRAIGESMEYKIPAMWKYENLMPWIVDERYVSVNATKGLEYISENKYIFVEKDDDPRISIYQRLIDLGIDKSIEGLWVAVPHPDADAFAKEEELSINYLYSDFLSKNDKFTQKRLLADLTPGWEIVKDRDYLNQLIKTKKTGFLKRRLGSGGFTIFNLETSALDKKFIDLFNGAPSDWFFEEFANGYPCSIQCVKDEGSNDVIVFGYSEQIITEGKYFAGSKIKKLNSLSEDVFNQLSEAINKLEPLLHDYEGFFGVDFMLDDNGKVLVLESNIRLTAATIPTLLTNIAGAGESEFHEDVHGSIKEGSIVLAEDISNNCRDILEFLPNSGLLGKSIAFELDNCTKVDKEMNEQIAIDMKQLIDEFISSVSGYIFKNFWPFGWTACFILEESHCVVSSWYLEKRILIDIFSCNVSVDEKEIIRRFKLFFQAECVHNIKIEKR